MHPGFLIAAFAAATLVSHSADAQTVPLDSLVRVHVITLDSTWYVTGWLEAVTGDSVVLRRDVTNARVAFERIHVLSVEKQVHGAGPGRSALIGCAVVGGVFGLAGLHGGGSSGGDGEISGPVVALAAGLVGCAVGGLFGAVIGAANSRSWQAITMPPRTGTEGDTVAVIRDIRDRLSSFRHSGPANVLALSH